MENLSAEKLLKIIITAVGEEGTIYIISMDIPRGLMKCGFWRR